MCVQTIDPQLWDTLVKSWPQLSDGYFRCVPILSILAFSLLNSPREFGSLAHHALTTLLSITMLCYTLALELLELGLSRRRELLKLSMACSCETE